MQKNSINKVMLVGYVGKKPELKYSPNQLAILEFRIATTESFKDRDGNPKEETEWSNITTFAKTAEYLANYLDKGSLICVEGRLKTSSWDDPNGFKRYKTEIIAREVTLLGGRSKNSSSEGRRDPYPTDSAPGGNHFGGEDDEPLPF